MTSADQEHRSNSVSAEQLRSFVERVERVRAEKKELSEDEKAVLAEAKANGFDTAVLKHCIKIRAQKPSDVEEARAITDLYLDALGMSRELPLFRSADLMAVDVTAREKVIEALKKFVPSNGSIVVEAGGQPVRLTRDVDGNVSVTQVVEKPFAPDADPKVSPRKDAKEVPAGTADDAEEMGRQAARDDAPIITNPFPFGDARRARWDLGWRKQAGNDGMGPDD